ncbi:hypothetical protein [Bacillus atrophaeus]|uniref:hypothetical protein n=1 Tax=Bacillus atrophaeus TaxID=1452 RepID=UPI003D1B6275
MNNHENDLMHCECGKRLEQFGGGICSDCFMKSVHESIGKRCRMTECPDCEGTGYDTWFEGAKKFQDNMVSCGSCGGKGEVEEGAE